MSLQSDLRKKVKYVLVISVVLAMLAGCSAPAAAPVTPQQPVEMVPRLGVNSLSIDVQFKEGDSKTVTRNITFMNEGEGVMVWAVRKTQPWIWMNEMDGALEKGYSKDLEIFIAPSGKTAGTYTDNLTIEGTGTRNSPQNVVVTMVITPPDATVTGGDTTVVKKTVPPPPWDYNEYKDSNYNFRLRYPKDYRDKSLSSSIFGAEVSSNSPQANSIRITIVSSNGVDFNSVALEWAKAIRISGGGSSPKVISSDNATTLLDGVTPAFEILYEAKSVTSISSQVYIYGVKKGSRYILFGAVAPLAIAPDRLQTWKEIAHTLEFID
ncbi:MAG: hypothetical protein NTV42_06005 [Chloroflexi bacterium]|nr:hypothetical protein [Chloroflexota bacterium]